jgi:hypothetical protein
MSQAECETGKDNESLGALDYQWVQGASMAGPHAFGAAAHPLAAWGLISNTTWHVDKQRGRDARAPGAGFQGRQGAVDAPLSRNHIPAAVGSTVTAGITERAEAFARAVLWWSWRGPKGLACRWRRSR